MYPKMTVRLYFSESCDVSWLYSAFVVAYEPAQSGEGDDMFNLFDQVEDHWYFHRFPTSGIHFDLDSVLYNLLGE